MKNNKLKYLLASCLCCGCLLTALTGCGEEESDNKPKEEQTSKKESVKNTFSNYYLTSDYEKTDNKNDAVWNVQIDWIKPKDKSIDVKYTIKNLTKESKELKLKDVVLRSTKSVMFVVSDGIGNSPAWLDDEFKDVKVDADKFIEPVIRYGENEDCVRGTKDPDKSEMTLTNMALSEAKDISYGGESISYMSKNETSSLNMDKKISEMKDKADEIEQQNHLISVDATKNSLTISPMGTDMPDTKNLNNNDSLDFSYTQAQYKNGKWTYEQGIYYDGKQKANKITVNGKEYKAKYKLQKNGQSTVYVISDKPIFKGKQTINIFDNSKQIGSYEVNTISDLEKTVKEISE